jgi:glycosyltransferase involved in cell wall biosynthesis
MVDGAILYDLTEFLTTPLRTGIQRVTFELARHWPGPAPLVPVCVSAEARFVRLPAETLALMTEFFEAAEAERAPVGDRLRGLAAAPLGALAPEDLRRAEAILNPEVFWCARRVGLYEALAAERGGRLFFLVYDCLPWLQPQWFARRALHGTMSYLRLVRKLPNLAFISAATRHDFLTRIVRAPRVPGPVIPLGSDALGVGQPRLNPELRFTVLGTLEPRKNLRTVLEAFQQLWHRGSPARLTFVGRAGWLPSEDWALFQRLRAEQPAFEWLPDLNDTRVRDVVRSSRATIYVSHAEGFGLSPLESLALGIPAIVTANLPSIQMIEPFGQLRLSCPEAASLARAVEQLLDDGFARRKVEEIHRLRLPKWSEVGPQVAAWIRDTRRREQEL